MKFTVIVLCVMLAAGSVFSYKGKYSDAAKWAAEATDKVLDTEDYYRDKVDENEKRIQVLELENSKRETKEAIKEIFAPVLREKRQESVITGYVLCGMAVWGIMTGGIYGVCSGLIFGMGAYRSAEEIINE